MWCKNNTDKNPAKFRQFFETFFKTKTVLCCVLFRKQSNSKNVTRKSVRPFIKPVNFNLTLVSMIKLSYFSAFKRITPTSKR